VFQSKKWPATLVAGHFVVVLIYRRTRSNACSGLPMIPEGLAATRWGGGVLGGFGGGVAFACCEFGAAYDHVVHFVGAVG
jgi:hypothetical protein